MIKSIRPFFYACCVVLIMTACKQGVPNRAKAVFRLNMHAGLSSLDPAFAKDQNTMWVCNQLYNGLVQLDDKMNVVPSIAKSWTISPDALTYTFHLRQDVFFHDDPLFPNGKGRRVVASDFVYSFQRIIDTTVASTGAWLFNEKVAATPFVALNDSTFVLKLCKPFQPMLGLLTLQYCSVVPKEVVAHYGKDFRAHPVGTGPFVLKRWDENNALVLAKHKHYFEIKEGKRLPLLDGVRISFIADRGVEFLKFTQGQLDFVSGIDASYKDKALTVEGDLQPKYKDKVRLERMPYLNTEYLGFSMSNQPVAALKNKKVRQAINYGIDRAKMILYLRNGIGIPAYSGIIPPGMASYDPVQVKGYAYDVSKAKQLLKEAGFPEGKGVGEIKLYSNPSYQDLVTFIANQLNELGLNVKIENTPPSFLREAMRKNEVSFFRASWIGDYPDGENYLALFYSGNGAPPNYTFFKNAQYDKLYLQALNATSVAQTKALYQAMERILIEEAPIVPLFYDEVVRFVNPQVKHFTGNAMNLLSLKEVTIER